MVLRMNNLNNSYQALTIFKTKNHRMLLDLRLKKQMALNKVIQMDSSRLIVMICMAHKNLMQTALCMMITDSGRMTVSISKTVSRCLEMACMEILRLTVDLAMTCIKTVKTNTMTMLITIFIKIHLRDLKIVHIRI